MESRLHARFQQERRTRIACSCDSGPVGYPLPATPPPLSPARGPPQHDFGFDADPGPDVDPTPAYDPIEPEPIPDFDFDQSRGA